MRQPVAIAETEGKNDMDKRPNFVFIMCDSMDGRKMGCMGSKPLARATPNLDWLASQGTMMANTYCANPVCVCSRASMLAGQYTHHCHAWNNYKGIPANSETFFKALEREGYEFGLFGKTDYVSSQHSQRARVTAWLRSAKIMKPQYNLPGPVLIQDDGTREVSVHDWQKVRDAVTFLDGRGGDDTPFFLYVSLDYPHPPLKTSTYYLNRIDREAIAVPPKDVDEHPVMAYMRMCKNWRHTPDDESVRLARAVYYAMIAEVDEMIGLLLDRVKEMGNTYVFFLSDHGEMNMEHGQYYKFTAFEPSARVPLIIAGPGVRKGRVVEHLESLVDIFPTVVELAGAQSTQALDGSSLVPILRGGVDARENRALCEYHDSGACTGIVMLRRDQYKYVAYPGYEPQLFDLDSDPWEIHNLSREKPEIVEQMDKELRSITDYEEHDRLVKAYDKDSFRVWRDCHKAFGDYDRLMSEIFSGAEDGIPERILPWTLEDEKLVTQWLEG